MFILTAIAFGLFTILYGLFASAILYHLRQYTLPGRPAPHIIIIVFLFLSGLFWLFGLYFLMKLPA